MFGIGFNWDHPFMYVCVFKLCVLASMCIFVCVSVFLFESVCLPDQLWVCVCAACRALGLPETGPPLSSEHSWPLERAHLISPPHMSLTLTTGHFTFSYLNLRYSPQIIQNLNFHHPLHWIGPPQMSLHRVPTVKKKYIWPFGQPPIWSSSWLQHSDDMKGW